MITDGKPSCVKKKDGSYYMNSNGLDSIVDKCYTSPTSKEITYSITTFMIANDPYLQSLSISLRLIKEKHFIQD
jgi:uncharacterized protein with von Willebrand factor type A (vWA) domain